MGSPYYPFYKTYEDGYCGLCEKVDKRLEWFKQQKELADEDVERLNREFIEAVKNQFWVDSKVKALTQDSKVLEYHIGKDSIANKNDLSDYSAREFGEQLDRLNVEMYGYPTGRNPLKNYFIFKDQKYECGCRKGEPLTHQNTTQNPEHKDHVVWHYK